MPDDLIPIHPEIVPRVTARERQVVAARRTTEQSLILENLRAHFASESARIEAEAAASATRSMIASELAVLRDGLAEAGDSAAAAKLVADKLELLSRANSAAFQRRFMS